MTVGTLPHPGDTAWPIDRSRGHYVEVVESDDDFVLIRCHYPDTNDSHDRKIRLSTYMTRYETEAP